MDYIPQGGNTNAQNNGFRSGVQAPQGYSPYGQSPQYHPPVLNFKQGGAAKQPADAAAGNPYAPPQVSGRFARQPGAAYTQPSDPYMPGQQSTQYVTPQTGNAYSGDRYAAPQTAGMYGGGQYSQRQPAGQYPPQSGFSGPVQPVNPYPAGQGGTGFMPPPQNVPYGYPEQYPQQTRNIQQDGYRSFIPPTPGMPQPPQPEQPPQTAYIPQTPYSAGSGMNAYQQAFGSYTQPVQNTVAPPPQFPLNGGGYVPKQPPVKRQPFEFDNLKLVLLCAVLIACFALGMFVPGLAYFKWIFTGLAAVSIILFWITHTVSGTKRLCFSVVFGALIVVSVIAALNGAKPASSRNAQNKSSVRQQTEAKAYKEDTDAETANAGQNVYTVRETAAPTEQVSDTSDVEARLNNFFFMWSANKMDEMLDLCLPSWQRSVETPKTALFGIMANRTPLDYTIEKISGGTGDTSRTVTLTSTIDRNNGKEPVKYRFSVIMVNEDGQWYVDPRSLSTNEELTTPDPNETVTPSPTIEPVAAPSTVLYYNPDGGTKYHIDPNCKSTHEKFLPMTAHFTYAEVNDPQYAKLKPCNVCAAPLRQ